MSESTADHESTAASAAKKTDAVAPTVGAHHDGSGRGLADPQSCFDFAREAEFKHDEEETRTSDYDKNNNSNNKNHSRHTSSTPPQEQPRAFQGGWQGFTLDERNTNAGGAVGGGDAELATAGTGRPAEASPDGTPSHPNWMARWEQHFPRTYHVVLFIVVPLMGLIGLAFLCGYGVARLEATREQNANDQVLATAVQKVARLERMIAVTRNAPQLCYDEYLLLVDNNNNNNNNNATNEEEVIPLRDYMIECGTRLAQEIQDIVQEFTDEWTDNLLYQGDLRFDWTLCRENKSAPRDRFHQADYFAATWTERAVELGVIPNRNSSDTTSTDGVWNNTNITSVTRFNVSALDQVVASDACQVNTAAGALFWFTTMTTIGYGNATPSTSGGRILVYTFGFLSILLFTVTIGQAGYVALVVADDFWHRIGWSRGTRGWTAVLLWAIVYAFWIVVVAGWAMAWSRNRYGSLLDEGVGGLPFRDAIWLAYISIVTVGFGDYYIPPDTVRVTDMLYMPLLFLIGFVLLANFLLKLSDVIAEKIKQSRKPSLESLLERTRTSDDNQQPAVAVVAN